MATSLLSIGVNPPTMDTLYITRKKSLFDHSAVPRISLSEWSAFVMNDPEMRLDNHTCVVLPNGEHYQYASPGTAVWLNRQPGQSEVRAVVFDYRNGNIVIADTEPQTIEKVRHLAFKLNARIFMETKSYTAELPVEVLRVKPRFQFSDAFIPFKRSLASIRYFFKHYSFSLFRGRRAVGEQQAVDGKI